MNDCLNSKERREQIVEFLAINKHSTRSVLAQKFNVSIRTIARDIVILSSKVPIFTKAGTHGGIYIRSDYKYKRKYLNSEEEKYLRELANTLPEDKRVMLLKIINSFSECIL